MLLFPQFLYIALHNGNHPLRSEMPFSFSIFYYSQQKMLLTNDCIEIRTNAASTHICIRICNEFIEETARHRNQNFGMWENYDVIVTFFIRNFSLSTITQLF